MFFGDIFTLLLQSILFWTSRKEIKLIQYKMDQKILWAVNKMPKTDDKNLPIMGLEEIKKARTFHESFPQYSETPLTKLPHMASYLGVKEVYVKDESYRFGLNAFKVLGGSFAMARYIAKETGKDVSELPYSVLTSEQLRKEFGQATFFTATDGNHGRGVAWVAANGMRMLAAPVKGDAPITSGESGAAPFGALAAMMTMDEYKDLRNDIGLDENSKVLLFSTEGDTDPDRYKNILWKGLDK